MADRKINWKYILITFVLALLAGGIILGYWWQIKKDELAGPDLGGYDGIGDGTELLEPLDTSDWQTYRDEKYGFEFRHPFYIKEGEEEMAELFYIYDYPSDCASCNIINIVVKFGTAGNENLLSISEWVNQNVVMTGLNTEDKAINIDGAEGLRRTYRDVITNKVLAVLIFFKHKDDGFKTVHHFETAGAFNVQIMDEVVSSLRFVD